MRLKHRIEYALVSGGLRLGNLFPWDWISGFGASLGWIVHALGIRRRVVMENLAIALGDSHNLAERKRIAAACYVQFGRSYWEYFGLSRFHQRKLIERFDYEGLEHLEAARAKAVSWSKLRLVEAEWEFPQYREFAPRTAWSLCNAFTHVAKGYGPSRQYACLRRLRGVFGTRRAAGPAASPRR